MLPIRRSPRCRCNSLDTTTTYFKVQHLSDGTMRRVEATKKVPQAVSLYRQYAGVIDHANHLRQGGVKQGAVPLEDAILTHSYEMRHFCGAIDFLVTNAYLAYRHFKQEQQLSHRQFLVAMVMGLLHNEWLPSKERCPILRDEEIPELPGEPVEAPAASFTPCMLAPDSTPKVQRNCVYCGSLTRFHCVKCSNLHDKYIHVCNPWVPGVGSTMCWARHLNNIDWPKRGYCKFPRLSWS